MKYCQKNRQIQFKYSKTSRNDKTKSIVHIEFLLFHIRRCHEENARKMMKNESKFTKNWCLKNMRWILKKRRPLNFDEVIYCLCLLSSLILWKLLLNNFLINIKIEVSISLNAIDLETEKIIVKVMMKFMSHFKVFKRNM